MHKFESCLLLYGLKSMNTKVKVRQIKIPITEEAADSVLASPTTEA